MNGIIGLLGVLAILIATGAIIGVFSRGQVSWRWLMVGAALVSINDAMLTQAYGLAPRLFPAAEWNWQGKVCALLATLAIAAMPAFGWRRCGITLRQARGSLAASIPVLLLYCAFFIAIAFAFPSGPASHETVAFQLTMPGFEEEPFYRGILLFALDRAFTGRVRLLGVDWGWGAVLSCAMFGLAHAFSYSGGQFTFDAMTMALTALPSFIAVWLRLRTGSVLLPVVMHNFGNSISLIL
ncbi:CPBP family intramembrane glutamic endopeptidase [Novosphingobium sp. ZN18A2]|uniref:CPBP family intramembrane glutamic endopeptidase, BDIM_20840 family n=1 Tax=Novosphingobium sp. ZN18A2 TaxID=3079861 RepID=UPI0030CB8594